MYKSSFKRDLRDTIRESVNAGNKWATMLPKINDVLEQYDPLIMEKRTSTDWREENNRKSIRLLSAYANGYIEVNGTVGRVILKKIDFTTSYKNGNYSCFVNGREISISEEDYRVINAWVEKRTYVY